MPLRTIEGADYVTLWVNDIYLPEGTPSVPGPEPQYDFIRSVELSILKRVVQDILAASK